MLFKTLFKAYKAKKARLRPKKGTTRTIDIDKINAYTP